MSKVFLCYSRMDEDFITELYRRLTRDGVDCYFDKGSIAWGAKRVVDLEKGLVESDVVVLVLSTDFCRYEWNRIEYTMEMLGTAADFRQKLRPLLLEPCKEDLTGFLRPSQYIDVSTDDRFEEAYPMICRALGGIVTEKD